MSLKFVYAHIIRDMDIKRGNCGARRMIGDGMALVVFISRDHGFSSS